MIGRKVRFSPAVAAAPYCRLVRRVFQGPGTAESAAVDREVLCPEEIAATRPPVYLAGQLDRLTASTGHNPLSVEIESMLAVRYTHAPTIAYHLRDAVLHDGSIYAKNMRHFIGRRTGRAGQVRHIRKGALASSAVGYTYFGHWLRDDCCQYLLAEQAGHPICVFRPSAFEHLPPYASCLRQAWTPMEYAVFGELTIYQDFAQNSLKHQRYRILSQRLAESFPPPLRRDKLIYLRRGNTGAARVVKDEPELINALQRNGFEIVDVAGPLSEIIPTLQRAKLVISMEGSHVAHCTFTLDPGCGLVLLQPADRFTAIHRHWTECVGVGLGFVVGEVDRAAYVFHPEEILRTADLVLSGLA